VRRRVAQHVGADGAGQVLEHGLGKMLTGHAVSAGIARASGQFLALPLLEQPRDRAT
jgi:hypothetical protein